MHFPRLLPAVVFALVLALSLSSPAPAWNLGPDLDIGSRSAILAEVGTGLVFFEKDPDRPNDPASVTKLLTLYVAFETLAAGLAHKGDVVTVSAKAGTTGGSSMHLATGEQVTVDELLHGIAIESGNDACVALAEYLMGSQDNFVLEMNLKADDLGMVNSFFMTPHGLTYADQQTTAADLLALARAYLERYPEAVELHKQKAYTHNGITGTNKNPLLGTFEGADGLKTGFTGPAGYNLVATAQRGGVRLIAVVLGAPNHLVRAADAKLLLETGFAMSASSYMVNMGTFRTWDEALDMRDKLKLMGHRASLEETRVNKLPALRVLVGPYPDTESALKAREVLQVDGFKPKFVVHRKRQGDDVRFSPIYPGQTEQADGAETDEPEMGVPETGVQVSGVQESVVPDSGGPVVDVETFKAGEPEPGGPVGDAAASGETDLGGQETGEQVTDWSGMGYPEGSAPETGMPETNTPEAGMTETGVQVSGAQVSGGQELGGPESDVPESGVPESNISESNIPESGGQPVDAPMPDAQEGIVPESGTAESGTPESGASQSGTAESGTPQSMTPESGAPESGTAESGTPGSGEQTAASTPGQDDAAPGPGHTNQPALAPDQDDAESDLENTDQSAAITLQDDPLDPDAPALDQDDLGQVLDTQEPAPIYGIPELDGKLAGKKELGASDNGQAPAGPPAPQGWSDPTP